MLRIIFLTGEGFLATFIVIRLLQSFIFWQWYLGFDPTLEHEYDDFLHLFTPWGITPLATCISAAYGGVLHAMFNQREIAILRCAVFWAITSQIIMIWLGVHLSWEGNVTVTGIVFGLIIAFFYSIMGWFLGVLIYALLSLRRGLVRPFVECCQRVRYHTAPAGIRLLKIAWASILKA